MNSFISNTWALLHYDFVQKALLSGLVLACAGGILGPLILSRRMSFTVHASSELALTGAAAALLLHISISLGAIIGCLIAAGLVAWLSHARADNDAITAVIMSTGLGIAILLLHFYNGRKTQAMELLTGQIISINTSGFIQLIIICVLISIMTLGIYPRLIFSTLEPELARTQGIATRRLEVLNTIFIALVTAEAMQIVGSLLVMSLLITPATSANYIANSLKSMIALSTAFAIIAAILGIIISLNPGWPVSAPITIIAFICYIGSRIYHKIRLMH